MNEFTIYTTDRVKINGKTIEDPNKIASMIKKKVEELFDKCNDGEYNGFISIYCKPSLKKEPKWKKWLRIIDPY